MLIPLPSDDYLDRLEISALARDIAFHVVEETRPWKLRAIIQWRLNEQPRSDIAKLDVWKFCHVCKYAHLPDQHGKPLTILKPEPQHGWDANGSPTEETA